MKNRFKLEPVRASRNQITMDGWMDEVLDIWVQCYKTFYVRNLQIFVIS